MLTGAAAGTLIVAGAGTVFVFEDGYRGWLHAILQRWLPGHRIEPKGFERFVADYNVRQAGAYKLRIFAAAEGVIDAKGLLPGELDARIEEEERRILTYFLIGSDFFDNYPGDSRTITYSGIPDACSSPFATFD